jgi:hypothetical protein
LHHIEYALNVDMTYNYLRIHLNPESDSLGVGRDGYSPLAYMTDDDLKKYGDKITALEKEWKVAYMKGPDPAGPNKVELDMALYLIGKFSENGTHLVFILNPRQNLDKLPEKLALFYALPAENRIDLADPFKYPELFTIKNSANLNHYDPAGAQIFTDDLAGAFIELVKDYSLELPGNNRIQ